MIKAREKKAILQSLRAGVVPKVGLRHIQVGRKDEVSAILDDLNVIQDGGASVRFIVGRYGAGKSFFLNLVRLVALEQRYVVLQADITPDRRLHASAGQAQSLYSELMHNAAVRSKPEGGALVGILERWISDVDHDVRQAGGSDEGVSRAIDQRLKPLQDLVSGYDFATVITQYYQGYQSDNDALMQASLKWLRGEYTTKTEARNDLGVRSIIGDRDIYEYLKLFASFVHLAGFAGLIVNLDEMGVLSHRLNSSQARNSNYEMVLRIVNDCLQGQVSHLGFLFAGTDEFVDDKRRGLASYEALATRLAENRFAMEGLRDSSHPVIRLPSLTPEDLFVLLRNIRHVFAQGDTTKYLLPDDALVEFMKNCSQVLGAEFYQTPRDVTKSFVGLLSVLEQNPGQDWRLLLNKPEIKEGTAGASGDGISTSAGASHGKPNANDDLTSFRL